MEASGGAEDEAGETNYGVRVMLWDRVTYLFEFELYALGAGNQLSSKLYTCVFQVLEWGAGQVCLPVCTCVSVRGTGREGENMN